MALLRFISISIFVLISQIGLSQCPNLVWSDEFDGNTLNQANWSYQIGDGCDINLCGWGNNELQSYQQANAVVADGELSITAKLERAGNSNYTSARIRSIDKVDFTYGRIEARIKLPSGGGLWPAFWMLSTDEPYGFWPQSGEIDIMEWVGNQKEKVFGTLHFGQPSPDNRQTGGTITSLDGDYGDEYHVYAVEWEANEIRWYIDDFLFSTKTRADVIPERWPFDHDYHLLLNMAIGGNFGGSVDTRVFPATMKVDYVRLYDGSRPRIQGDRYLSNTSRIGRYTLTNVEPNATIDWSAPAGVTILSGQGTPSVEVQWISAGGFLVAEMESSCGSQTLSIEIAPGVARSGSLENFDDTGLATFEFSSGVLTEVQNPAPNAVNNSATVGRYQRAASNAYDVLVYGLSNVLGDVTPYTIGSKKLYIDVYSSAPTGTEILVQLETSSARTSDYPTGRHSRYQAYTTAQNQWHRLPLQFIDLPDANANPNSIVQAPILFDPGNNSGDIFYYDNFDIYDEAGTVNTQSILKSSAELSVSQNPVNESTNAILSLEKRMQLELLLVNALGQPINTIDLGTLDAGRHEIPVETAKLPNGNYTLTLRTKGVSISSVGIVKN